MSKIIAITNNNNLLTLFIVEKIQTIINISDATSYIDNLIVKLRFLICIFFYHINTPKL